MKKYLFALIAMMSLLVTGCNKPASVQSDNPQSLDNSNESSGEVLSESESESVSSENNAPKGTLENPYSIKEALAVIGTNTNISSTKIYITGTVSGNPYHNTTYNSYSAYLMGDGASSTVQVYSGTIDANAGQKDVKDGDVVVAGGYYMYYSKNSQAELAGDSSHDYPIYYSIVRGSGGGSTTEYETLEDNGRETVETTIAFTSANAETMRTTNDRGNYMWKNGIVTMECDNGSQYSTDWTRVDPFRFYVGTYLHFRVSSGQIKYIKFVTDQNYPFQGSEPITNGKVTVQSNTLSYVFAKKGGTNYIKIHKSVNGQVSNVAVKQIRMYSLIVVSYK